MTSGAPTAAASRPAEPELAAVHDWWRAANYLAVGQIYLQDNPLLTEPLVPAHIKPRLLGHWGTTPGLTFLWAHLNRVIARRDLEALFVTGPGHGGPAVVATAWLEGTYSDRFPAVSRDAAGMRRLFRQFSFPGGIPSHAAPETPGSIHEGGELGYSLAHAYGAAMDNPDLLVACVIGDGEAETGALATSWHGNKFLDPATDGTVLPILHLNGWKIANPTVLARIPERELRALLEGYGHEPYFCDVTDVEAGDPMAAHARMAAVFDRVFDAIERIRSRAARGEPTERPRWPVIVLRSPKGWTGPARVDGVPVEGTWRSHQLPLTRVREDSEHLALLERWLRSYRADELFDAAGCPRPELDATLPRPARRMSATPYANGGELLRPLRLPELGEHLLDVPAPGSVRVGATGVLGGWIRDVITANPETFRLFGPDEVASNRLQAVFEVTDRVFDGERRQGDDHLAARGRVLEVLSEHLCEGWLEGYLLTGRHGIFTCYEAFIHIVDSMLNQHAKWLKVSREIPWRRPIASLNYLLTSHVWQQDHNGFSHQDPGFIDHVVNKKSEIVRVYLPPDANTLLATMDHCMGSRDRINVVVAGKQPAPQWLDPDAAVAHTLRGIGIWDWASNDAGTDPDVVLACCGDVPTVETLAAVTLLRHHLPQLRVRVVNVVDLMRLQDPREHPHGLPDREYDALFPPGTPTIMAFHGYPWLIHRLTYRRADHDDLHVRGYIENGTTTTPFDMLMLNDLDRFHLAADVIDRVPGLGVRHAALRQHLLDERLRCRAHTRRTGEDAPDIANWVWPG
ncbi:phosphoketolase family protein [Pseudonocardia sp. K10HN5]|uniref:Probable phosphoketolase n=1 Tax=Pseudonocardia acidicola TaxID=2724939 RepID=A0ABX1S7L6_9PSEU|nr:phosphoketolase family protein [Pseudonocardia acidicola]